MGSACTSKWWLKWLLFISTYDREYRLNHCFNPSFLKHSIFRDTTPFTLLKVNWHFGGICHLYFQAWRVSQARNQHEAGSKQIFAFFLSSMLKTKAICSSKTLVDFQQTTQHYIPEDWTLHNHCCKNFRYWLQYHSCSKAADTDSTQDMFGYILFFHHT
jgi:hypothetical protein